MVTCENGALITAESPFYAELGGQVGDSGGVEINGQRVSVVNTGRAEGRPGVIVHRLAEPVVAAAGDRVTLYVDESRRGRIEAHHNRHAHLALGSAQIIGKYRGAKRVVRGARPAPIRFCTWCSAERR